MKKENRGRVWVGEGRNGLCEKERVGKTWLKKVKKGRRLDQKGRK